jgi:hypothetical protein
MNMSDKVRRIIAELLSACVLFALGAATGMAVLVALFKLGVAAHVDILFYRGVVLCAIAFTLTIALLGYIGHLTGRASFRDAIAAGFLSLGLNLSVLVIAPVTVDRSVSIFILGYMAAHDGRTFTTDQIETALRDVYFGELHQIDRRMLEQQRSGNVSHTREGYVISTQGLTFVRWARWVGALFDVDPRLIQPKPASVLEAAPSKPRGAS